MPLEILPPANPVPLDPAEAFAALDVLARPGSNWLADAVEPLAGLEANRTFLGDLVIAELKNNCAAQVRNNGYGSQVLLLKSSANGYVVRANLWPSAHDPCYQLNGPEH